VKELITVVLDTALMWKGAGAQKVCRDELG
jgi:hypothetical protein